MAVARFERQTAMHILSTDRHAHISPLPVGTSFAAQFGVSTRSACGSTGAPASGQRQPLQRVNGSPVRAKSKGCEDVRQELASLYREPACA